MQVAAITAARHSSAAWTTVLESAQRQNMSRADKMVLLPDPSIVPRKEYGDPGNTPTPYASNSPREMRRRDQSVGSVVDVYI